MKKSINLLFAFLIIISTLCLSASAEGGDGTGGGDGQGVPALSSSSVPTGSTGVDTNVEITLTFEHNVANMSVKDDNMTCFTLKDSGGSTGDFYVIIGDDQVDPTVKRIIKIQTHNLKPLTVYTLTISSDLKAKNGTKLGTPVSITFTTKDEPTPSTTKKPTGGGVYYPVTTAAATTTAPSAAPATTVSRRRPKVTTTAAAITNTTAKSIAKSTTKAPALTAAASSAIATTKSQEVITTQSEVTELTQAVLLVSSTGGETEGQTALTDLTPQTPYTISAGAENQSGSRAVNIIVITLAAGAAAAVAIVIYVKKKK